MYSYILRKILDAWIEGIDQQKSEVLKEIEKIAKFNEF
jgi:hypothetical protein